MGAGSSNPEEIRTPKELSSLSPQEHNTYNRLAVRMEQFHEHFRHTWTMLYDAAITKRRPSNFTQEELIDAGIRFVDNLEGHHRVEETYIFPVLAKRMPEFRHNGRNQKAAELILQHEEIHRGMTAMREYLIACKDGIADFQFSILQQKMDSWGKTLWIHLEQEVKVLGVESMRQYWTMDEMTAFPF
ncbi:neutrophil cytosol factor 2 protein [Colletotrichum tofieldiae]|uniref:Neutrophil cytosol factor 2 protein n=1 Tax=Colletotrichum tofieldiae TaxID=708197 RepID=A0A166MK05_9PEZI|nr:neutrophil cytosol factor 2 protein [Colletotrichum tofieldiae]